VKVKFFFFCFVEIFLGLFVDSRQSNVKCVEGKFLLFKKEFLYSFLLVDIREVFNSFGFYII
jgi:hypothetical protein